MFGWEAGRVTKLNRIIPQNNDPPEMAVNAHPDPEGHMNYVRWLRANTEIKGFTTLCDDACTILAKYCEGERLAVLQKTNGKMKLLTAPLVCTSFRDERVRQVEWSQEGACTLYSDSTGIRLLGEFSNAECKSLPGDLANSIIRKTNSFEKFYGEHGNYSNRNGWMRLPNGKCYSMENSFDARHDWIMFARHGYDYDHSNIDGFNYKSGKWEFHIERDKQGGYIQYFMLDQNTVIQFDITGANIYDIRNIGSKPIFLPHTNKDLRCRRVRRNGDALTRTIRIPGGDVLRNMLASYNFDLRSGWVPYYSIEMPGARSRLSHRAYWG